MALVGFMNTLCLEGHKYGIRVNALSPIAATRMTEDLMPDEILKLLQPQVVTPAVIFMCSKDAPNRQIIAAGAGGFAKVTIKETPGIFLKSGSLDAENIAARWDKIADGEGECELQYGAEQTEKFLAGAQKLFGTKFG